MESPINFYSEVDFEIQQKESYKKWLETVLESEQKEAGDINYVFCSDEHLLEINKTHLDHNTFTDIITFDYTVNKIISAEIYISIDRVKENAQEYKVSFDNELKRVMVHGILHCCGYGDSTKESKANMKELENKKIELFHVEQK